MSQFKITAVEGLRTEGEAENVWDDFYTAEKEQKQETDRSGTAKIQVENEANYDDDFDDSEDDDDDDEEDSKSRETPRINPNLNNSLNSTSTERLDTESDSQSSTGQPRKKGKGKKFKSSSNGKPPPLNLYHNQLRDRLHYSKDRSSSFNQDTLSDQEVKRRRGRKLHRRGQMKKYHSLEQAVEQAGRDRLEQKYIELEELISRPLMENRRVQVPVQQQQQQPQTQQQRTSKKHQRRPAKRTAKEGESTESKMKAWISNSTLNEDETTDRQAYSTLCKLQTTTPASRKHNSSGTSNLHTAPGPELNSHPPQQQNARLTSKPPVPRRRTVSEDSLPSTSSDTKSEDHSRSQQNGFDAHFVDRDDHDDKFGDVSPRSVYLPTDMHLKYTDNPKLQDWLKRKNVEHRQARKAERVKKREERLQKQGEVEQRQARREKSSERVKQWMDVKRKESVKQQKEERRRRKQEAQEQAAQKARSAESAVRGSRIDRPQSAPSPNKKHTPIKRPESAARLENGGYMAPKPPDTKFVYKRPVSGKVRLMKLQNEKKAKDAEQKKLEELTPEEREQKTRMSYDAWLIAKRREDTDKRREVKRQEVLMKSDPEIDRLVPELAIRRIERINKEKKSIETGVSVIDDKVNKQFGGGSFGKDVKKPSEKSEQDSIPEPSSYGLSVEGSASTLIELNARARPVAAKTRMPIPQSTFSPRRPPTAKPSRDSSPKVRAVMDRDHMAEPNPFKLPFSGDFTTSLQIRRIQERVSTKLTTPEPDDAQRPEPQGCAASEAAACPKGLDSSPKPDSFPKGLDSSPKPDSTPRSSLVLLQQIEAAAVQSELETQQTTSENTPPTSEGEASDPGPGKEAKKLFITEPGQADDPSEHTQHQKKEEGKEEKEEEKIPVDLGQEKVQDDDTEKISRNQPPQNSFSEGRSGPEDEEPDAVQEPHKPDVNAALQDTKETEERPAEPSASSPADPEDNAGSRQATEQNRQEGQSSAAEDSPRRSMKRVSFSEELATVFQSPSPDTSSNFEDERGADDEVEDPHLSLDNLPDPE